MELTGERAVADGSYLYHEHVARYTLADRLVRDALVLDAGCGTGYGSHHMATKGATLVVGIDRSVEAIRYSRSHYQRTNLSFLVADCSHLPFSEAAFDVVVALELIEHLSDYEGHVTEVERVLAGAGVYVASTPNRRTHSPLTDKPYNPFHVKEFYAHEIEALLKRHFAAVRVSGQRFVQGFVVFEAGVQDPCARIRRHPLDDARWDLEDAKDLVIVATEGAQDPADLLLGGDEPFGLPASGFLFLAEPFAGDLVSAASVELPQLRHEVMSLRQLAEAYRSGRFMRAMEAIHRLAARLRPEKERREVVEATELGLTWDKPIPLPRKLVVEAFGGCNLRCPLCPTGQGRLQRARGPMDIQLFAEVLRQFGGTLQQIDLFNWGEPLLNPRLGEMISLARSRGIFVAVSTNLNHLPDPAGLVASGLNRLIVSCSGCTPETYAKYHVGGDSGKVMTNLRKILTYRDLNPDLEIAWRFLRFPYNDHEVPLVLETCRDLGIEADICEPRLDMREEIITPVEERIDKYGEWVPPGSAVYDTERRRRKGEWSTCLIPWTEACIDVDGSVMVCCSSYDRKYDLGNVLSTSFERIWNGPLYRAAREYLEAGTATSGIRTLCHLCKDNGFRDY